MNEILDNLIIGESVHITHHGTQYMYIGRSDDMGVKYSINRSRKILPFQTINAALIARNNNEDIDAQWYKGFNLVEYKNRPCNLSVLNGLLSRL